MITKIIKNLKKMRNLTRLQAEDLGSFLEMEVNNGIVDGKELWKKAKEFLRN